MLIKDITKFNRQEEAIKYFNAQDKLNEKITPFVFMFPALLLLAGISLWPTIDTLFLSFKNNKRYIKNIKN